MRCVARQRRPALRAALTKRSALYKRAVALQPSWTEGYWYLGTIYYDRDRHAECRDAFTRVVQRQPENGAAWAFRGLCEFRLKQYRAALDHLNRARQVGVGDDPAFDAIVAYHRAILFARFGQFERAFDVDVNLVRGGNTMPAMLDAIGIAMLRLPLLPDEVPPEQRDLVRLTGRAGAYGIQRMADEARKAYEELLTRYPDAPGVHFLYGNFLFGQERPDAALEQFRMEIARSPNHVPARLQLALELVKRGDFDAAKPYATEAVRLAPGNFVARRVLGQIKLQAGDVAGAIADLEAAPSSSRRARACASTSRAPTSARDAPPMPNASAPSSGASRSCSRSSAAAPTQPVGHSRTTGRRTTIRSSAGLQRPRRLDFSADALQQLLRRAARSGCAGAPPGPSARPPGGVRDSPASPPAGNGPSMASALARAARSNAASAASTLPACRSSSPRLTHAPSDSGYAATSARYSRAATARWPRCSAMTPRLKWRSGWVPPSATACFSASSATSIRFSSSATLPRPIRAAARRGATATARW